MPDTHATRAQLLPTVSIVEETMRQARRAMALALAGAAFMTAVLLAERLWSSAALERAADRHAMSHRLAAQVRLADEQLTMAGQMAAITVQKEWIDRFDKGVPELAQTIDHAALLAPPEAAQIYQDQTRAAAALLARMRASALEALNSGAGDAARTLFDSERYKTQTRLMREAADRLTAASIAATESELTVLRVRSAAVAFVGLVLSLGMGAALWRRLSAGLNRSRGSLLDAEERIQRLAASDLLTGLDNRAALHDAMHAVMVRAERNGDHLAVLMVDLDRFKPVNDRHGHMVGDLVLKEVARRLSRCLRQSDLRARYGGDEFVVVVEDRAGTDTARAAADSICERLARPMQFGELTVSIGASIGISRYPADATSDDELLRKADSALYRAKQVGRGGVCLYDPKLDEALSERNQLEVALRDGIAAGQLVPFYQPIVDLQQRRVLSLELLCRWRHPTRGLLPPDKFIALAEDTGLIGPLTMSLLRQACKDLALFPEHWRLSFNVAPQQIQDETLVPELLAILTEHHVSPQRFDVELTETALVNDTARAREVIMSLKRAGMTVTLDDFGTGYSSLSYLAEMTFDKIKIDRSFVRTLRDRPESAKIVHAIVGLSRSLGVDTVAEGVETEEEARLLQRLGCHSGQGYLFGRPVKARDLQDRYAAALAPLDDAWARAI
jgi:diguanylate cyclase (GGDEF)-like protein